MQADSVPWETRAELSVLSIYRDHNSQTEGPLPLWDLEQRWADYGVRYTDLPNALSRLAERRVIDWRDDGHAIELTPTGEQWFSNLPAALEYKLVVMRRRQTEARKKIGSGSRSTFRRCRDLDDAAIVSA